MRLEEYTKEQLWLMLVETVHATVMYPAHKAYTREEILRENPVIGPDDLASRLNIPLGEALIILNELRVENKNVA